MKNETHARSKNNPENKPTSHKILGRWYPSLIDKSSTVEDALGS